MRSVRKAGFVCFGEVNTPYERLKAKHDQAWKLLGKLGVEAVDAGIVLDDPGYGTAQEAIRKLEGGGFCCLVICVAGWIPSHAVIQVTDPFRHIPMLLWGLCGWMENGHIVTTADQAGTTALRPVFEEMGYRFSYVYSTMDQGHPEERIDSFIRAAYALQRLRQAKIGTMGYRDMLLYGTQCEGTSLRHVLGIETEPFEMLEMVQNAEKVSRADIETWKTYIDRNWCILNRDAGAEETVERGVRYALAIGRKVEERGYDAVTLLDVDGMKKLLGFPPAMVFMLLNRIYSVQVIPENDILGSATQLLMHFATDQTVPYLEYYEFFKDCLLAGVPDFIPEPAADGPVTMLPAAFGLLDSSLLNVSRVKPGYVTCSRLLYRKGRYAMHFYTGDAKKPPVWEECGWDAPAPQLPSLAIYPDSCTVEEFAQKVGGQHTIVSYGNHAELIRTMCRLADLDVL
jgi:L-arabinose isomerase